MNCSTVGLFHGMQSFSNRLLQRGSPMGSQALPANLLQRGLLSSRGHRSCQEPAPVWPSHVVTASFRHPHAPAWGPFHGLQVEFCSTVDLRGLQGRSLPHHCLHHRLQGKLCSRAWSTYFPSFCTDPGVCRAVSLTVSLTTLSQPLLHRFFFTVSQICYCRDATAIADELTFG